VETAFLDLRRVIDAGATIDADAVRREVARATLLLDGAEEQRRDKSVPFLAALAIALREGFEIALLISALLAFVRKSGHPESAPYVHYGWLLALPAGAVTWFVVGAALGGARRELTEGVLTLVAAGMLLFVSHFVLGKLESMRWLKFLEKKTRDSSTRPWPLMMVAFVAVYREAIEVVLFFRALALDSPGRAGAIAAGVAVGALALAALVFVMQQLGRRLNPRPVMVVSGILLTALALSLVGQGVRALQEGGYLPLSPWRLFGDGVPVLGLYPTIEGLGTQLAVLALVLLPWWLERKRAQPIKLA
jgi:high-affinity iron transporter